jgi:hypothetical protein
LAPKPECCMGELETSAEANSTRRHDGKWSIKSPSSSPGPAWHGLGEVEPVGRQTPVSLQQAEIHVPQLQSYIVSNRRMDQGNMPRK